MKMLKTVCSICISAVLLVGMSGCSSSSDSDKTTIRVGSKDFTEGLIVSEIYALALEKAGFQVERTFDIAGSLVHTSLINDEIDLYPEYTGTALLSILKKDMITDSQEVYDTVKAAYKDEFQLTWLNYSTANDGQGLVIRTELAEKLGIKTISDLQKHAQELRFASQGEFDQRDDGMPALIRTYGDFVWKDTKVYDSGLKYQVLENDEADVAPAYTTDAQLINKDRFRMLEDDLHVWPPYNLAPVVRDSVLEASPAIKDVLDAVSAKLDTETLIQLNAKVDIDKEEYEDVAREYFESLQ